MRTLVVSNLCRQSNMKFEILMVKNKKFTYNKPRLAYMYDHRKYLNSL